MHRLLVESTLLDEESPVLPADAARQSDAKWLPEIATPTSFGPTILRAETAAICAVSIRDARPLA